MFTVIGTFLGGIFRMMPEVLKWLDRNADRSHELAMFDKQLEADKLQVEQNKSLAFIQAEAAISVADMQALMESTRAQATVTGIRWVDAVNSLMRPLITFWWVIVLYTVDLAAGFLALVNSGVSHVEALQALWGVDEKAIVASIIAFWFVDRSLRVGKLK